LPMRARRGLLLLAAILIGAPSPAQDDFSARIQRTVASGDLQQALALAAEWIEAEPDDPAALTTHGALAMRCGAYEEAVESYEAARFFADTAEVATRLGDALLELGRAGLALDSYRHALGLDDRLVAAHVGTGRALLAMDGDATAARLCLQSALAIDPESAEAKVALAEVDVAQWRLSEARQALREVTKSHPQTAAAWLLLGRLTNEAGDLPKAREYWERYAELEPARPETWLLHHDLLPSRPRTIPIRGSYFVLSPDGTKLAYVGAGAEANQQVLLIDAEGKGEPRTVCQLPGRPMGVAWSPDGKRLVIRSYERVEKDGKREWEYTLTTTDLAAQDLRTVIRDKYLGMPVYMPEGERLCFDAPLPRRGRVLVVCEDRADATIEHLAACPQGTYAQWLNWSRDGATLAAGTYGYTPVGHYDLVTFPATNMSAPVTLYSTQEAIYYPTVTPDGKTVVFLQMDDQRNLALLCVDVGVPSQRARLMLRDSLSAAPPSLSPDGKSLLTYRASGLTVYRLVGLNG